VGGLDAAADDAGDRGLGSAVEAHRRRCWLEFCEAVDAGVAGDYGPAQALIAKGGSPGELRSFIRAVKEGRLVKKAPGEYRRK
jgi:hypothetical protein